MTHYVLAKMSDYTQLKDYRQKFISVYITKDDREANPESFVGIFIGVSESHPMFERINLLLMQLVDLSERHNYKDLYSQIRLRFDLLISWITPGSIKEEHDMAQESFEYFSKNIHEYHVTHESEEKASEILGRENPFTDEWKENSLKQMALGETHIITVNEDSTPTITPLISIGQNMLEDLLNEQEEVISSPTRFNGVHIEKIKQVFEKYGITLEQEF
jgi:hypothetical protein